jgi:8-oxo-dGTP diphosphatase
MMSRSKRISAYGVIVDKDERILLCRLSKIVVSLEGKFILPGGGIEYGEHPEVAVVREVKEETGLTATVKELLTVESEVIDFPEYDGKKEPHQVHAIRIIYRVEVEPGELKVEKDNSTDACGWFTREEAEKLPLVKVAKRGLELFEKIRGSESGR